MSSDYHPPPGVVAAASSDLSVVAVATSSYDDSSSGTTNATTRIRCYDGATSLGSPRFTLVDRPPPLGQRDETADDATRLELTRLAFAGDNNEFLVACHSPSPEATIEGGGRGGLLVVWDLKRGVASRRIEAPSGHYFCDVAASGAASRCYALARSMDKKGKVVVLVYDVTSGKLTLKIKAGSASSYEAGDDSSGTHGTGQIALSEDGTRLAVRVGDKVRILKTDGGKRLCRFSIGGGGGARHRDRGLPPPLLRFSDDGGCILASAPAGGTTSGEHLVHVYPIVDGGDGDGDEGEGTSTPASSKSSKSGKKKKGHHHQNPVKSCLVDSCPTFAQMIIGDATSVIAITCSSGSVSLFSHSHAGEGRNAATAGAPVKACGRVVTSSTSSSSSSSSPGVGGILALFHQSSPGERLLVVRHHPSGGRGLDPVFETPRYRSGKGGGGGGASILKEIVVKSSLSSPAEGGADAAAEAPAPKRSRAGAVLGPGEGGMEAPAVDFSQGGGEKKKARTAATSGGRGGDDGVDEEAVDEIFDDGEAGENVVTVADRLRALSERLREEGDGTDDDDDDSSDADDEAGGAGEERNRLIASSSSTGADGLLVVLAQALRSNDESKLEVALSCNDRAVVERTVASIDPSDDGGEMILTLLGKLVHRIARRPARAEWLGGVWVREILLAHSDVLLGGGRRNGEDDDDDDDDDDDMERRRLAGLTRALGPLKNLLTERTEAFPHLLKLEGRLALMGRCYRGAMGGS